MVRIKPAAALEVLSCSQLASSASVISKQNLLANVSEAGEHRLPAPPLFLSCVETIISDAVLPSRPHAASASFKYPDAFPGRLLIYLLNVLAAASLALHFFLVS